MEMLARYFPGFSPEHLEKFRQLELLLQEWNLRLNLVSRKDMVHLQERHLLHSLSIGHFSPLHPEAASSISDAEAASPDCPWQLPFLPPRLPLLTQWERKYGPLKIWLPGWN